MGYYIRVLGIHRAQPSADELNEMLESQGVDLRISVEEETEGRWTALTLAHNDGQEAAAVECNQVAAGSLAEAELKEYHESVADDLPREAAAWLQKFFPRVQTIFAIQILPDGAARGDGWKAISAIHGALWERAGGILQADGEGFSNEQGHHILWQFSDGVKGPWEMALLQPDGKWIAFSMQLGNRKQRGSFLKGEVPKGATLL